MAKLSLPLSVKSILPTRKFSPTLWLVTFTDEHVPSPAGAEVQTGSIKLRAPWMKPPETKPGTVALVVLKLGLVAAVPQEAGVVPVANALQGNKPLRALASGTKAVCDCPKICRYPS